MEKCEPFPGSAKTDSLIETDVFHDILPEAQVALPCTDAKPYCLNTIRFVAAEILMNIVLLKRSVINSPLYSHVA
jgi:hypothetical protein